VHITNYLCFSVNASARAQISVVDAHQVYANLDPAFHFDAYPDPAYHFDADPDPDPTFTLMQIQIRESATSGLKILQGSTVSQHGSKMSLLGFIVSLHSIKLLTLIRMRIRSPFYVCPAPASQMEIC
jgi:hypothetical protein